MNDRSCHSQAEKIPSNVLKKFADARILPFYMEMNGTINCASNLYAYFSIYSQLYRAVGAYLKVVRQKKPPSPDCMRKGESTRGGPPPRIFLNFKLFDVRFNGFLCFGPDFSRFGYDLLQKKETEC